VSGAVALVESVGVARRCHWLRFWPGTD